MSGKPWTEAEIKKARAIVSEHTSMNAALRDFPRRLNRSTTATNFRRICDSRGFDDPKFLLKEAAPPVVDPVERREQADDAKRDKAEKARLITEVSELRRIVAMHHELTAKPLAPIKRRELGSGLREGCFVAMLSDCHVEERVLPGDTPTGNAYNLDIADLRLGRFFSGVEWLINNDRKAFHIRDGILWLGGDLMSGHIHDELKETTAMSPIATMLWIQPRIVAGIRQLLERCELESLQVICSYGNHGRDTLKPRRSTGAHHSYEWGMYQQIAKEFKDEPRIKFLADPSGHQYAKAYGFDLHFHHGDETNYQGGVGGITIPLNKAVAQWDKARRCDFHHFGHWHQYIDTGNILVNGSLIGYNAYAMAIKATPEPPQQAFYILDAKRGKTRKSPVWVGDASAEKGLI